jgi:hypothetical protein
LRLDEYVWSRNPRGLHCISIFQSPLEIQRYTRPRLGWAKLLAVDTGFVDDAQNLLANNVTPLVRLYMGRHGAGPFTRQHQSIVYEFARAGVKWFEFYNEPNIDVEWPEGFDPTWEDFENVIRPMMDNWLNFAEYVISLGCYPGFPALAESTVPRYATIRWLDAFLNYLAQFHYDRFRTLLANGMYVCAHPLIVNHFYQEVPGGGPFSTRAPLAQRGTEPGWHFEYPYDPICQRDDPGRTITGGTARTPFGDPNGLEATGRYINDRLAQLFGTQAVPVVGTEGGIWPFRNEWFQQDNRYPPYNEVSQAEATIAMYEWIARVSPPWYFGVCMWKEDEFYDGDYVAPAIGRLEEVPPILKPVPPIDVMGTPTTPQPTLIPGPGPIHGSADHHIVVLAIGLTSDWFFETAQAYYAMFRPVVTTQPEIIDYIPNTQSLAVTLITQPEQAALLQNSIRSRYPNVYIDVILADDIDRVKSQLEQRAQRNLRFG